MVMENRRGEYAYALVSLDFISEEWNIKAGEPYMVMMQYVHNCPYTFYAVDNGRFWERQSTYMNVIQMLSCPCCGETFTCPQVPYIWLQGNDILFESDYDRESDAFVREVMK